MAKIDQSKLLQFLRKPRFVREVAKHFGISTRLADVHLREAIKSGHVLSTRNSVLKISGTLKDKLEQAGGFLYVLSDSSEIGKNVTKHEKNESSNQILRSGYCFPMFQSTKIHGSVDKNVINRLRKPDSFEETQRFRNLHTDQDAAHNLRLPSSKVKTVKRILAEHSLTHETRLAKDIKSLSILQKIDLLRTLLKPANFLDLHGRFGVSKETIKSLVKNDLLKEVWGPKAVGLRFKLTRKGKTYLKELEGAARYEPQMEKKAFIKLKHMTPF
jgi:hypothetical protein